MMHNVTLKSSLSQQASVYRIHKPWLVKSEKKALTNFQILPGEMSQNILSKRQVCTQKNQWKHINLLKLLITLYVDKCSNVFIIIFISPANFVSSNQRWEQNGFKKSEIMIYVSEAVIRRCSVEKLLWKS